MLFTQGLGFLGVFLNLIIFWQKSRKRMLINKLVANGVWAVHYYLLGAYSATAIAVIGMVSTSVFVSVDPKKKKRKNVSWWIYYSCYYIHNFNLEITSFTSYIDSVDYIQHKFFYRYSEIDKKICNCNFFVYGNLWLLQRLDCVGNK